MIAPHPSGDDGAMVAEGAKPLGREEIGVAIARGQCRMALASLIPQSLSPSATAQ